MWHLNYWVGKENEEVRNIAWYEEKRKSSDLESMNIAELHRSISDPFLEDSIACARAVFENLCYFPHSSFANFFILGSAIENFFRLIKENTPIFFFIISSLDGLFFYIPSKIF